MTHRSQSKTHKHDNKHEQPSHQSPASDAQDGKAPVSTSEPQAVSAPVAGPLRTRIQEGKDAVVHEIAEIKSSVETELRHDLDQAKTLVRTASKGVGSLVDRAQRIGESAVGGIRANPIPAALIGAGLTWMVVNAVRTRGASAKTSAVPGTVDEPRGPTVAARIAGAAHSVQSSVSTAMDSVVKETGAVAHRVQASLSEAGSATGHAVTDAAHSVAREARQLEQTTEQTFQRNPLAVGAALFAAGAAIGFVLPHTGAEDSLVGSARDSVMHTAGGLVHGALNRVEGIAKVVAGPSTHA